MGVNVKESWPLIVAGLAIVAAIVYYSRSSAPVSVGSQVVSNSVDNTNAAIASSNAAAASNYAQTITSEFSQLVGFGGKIQDNLTAVNEANIAADVAKTQSANALAAAHEQSQAEITIAQYQRDAQINAQNAQLAAIQGQQHVQQQQNLWNGIFSTVAGFFGF